ncbi:hypothetical protein BH20CHL6_BH20CHL6_17550 [soil metagenome]
MVNGDVTLSAIELFVALVAAAAVVALLARRVALPYTVSLVVFGLGAAVIGADAIDFEITPELVLAVLLPGLIFDAAYRIDFKELSGSFGGVALLAVPGVLFVAGLVAVVLHLATGLPIELGFVVGAMVSATDPAAVIATFKRLSSPRRLATLVEGESLFNDGTALVVFAISLRAVQSQVGLAEASLTFVGTVVISTLIGVVAGFLASRIIATVDDHLIELTISLVAAYGTYLIADAFHESGIIATVVAGIVIGNYGRRIGMSPRTEEALDTVWEFFAFLLTALVFLLVGLAITLPQLVDSVVPILWGVAAILVGRALVVYLLLGVSSRLLRGRRSFGDVIPIPWLHVTFWSGLRGAVAVAMALSLPSDFPQRVLLQEITFGVVLFTLLVQGTTVELVIRRSGTGAEAGGRPEQEPAVPR